MTRIFVLDTDRSVGALEALEAEEPRLSADELRRVDGISDIGRRRTWRAAHIALRVVLERSAGPDLRRLPYALGDRGRPFLPPPAPSFSLSHTDGLAIIAVHAQGPVGADVERLRAVFLTPERQLQIIGAATAILGEAPADALVAWTVLEALGKAMGDGVGAILEQLRRPPHGLDLGRMRDAGLKVERLSLPTGFVGSIACPVSSEPVRLVSVPADVVSLRAFAAGRDEVDLPGMTGQKDGVRSVAQPG